MLARAFQEDPLTGYVTPDDRKRANLLLWMMARTVHYGEVYIPEPVLARTNGEGVPCYLETVNPGNLPFYQKYGFKVAYEGQPAKNAPCFWAMVREPA